MLRHRGRTVLGEHWKPFRVWASTSPHPCISEGWWTQRGSQATCQIQPQMFSSVLQSLQDNVPSEHCRSLLWGGGGIDREWSSVWTFLISNSAHLSIDGPSLVESFLSGVFKKMEKIGLCLLSVLMDFLSSVEWSEESLAVPPIICLTKIE